MRAPGWDPRRRNRRLGVAGAGRGADNAHVIPCRWEIPRHWARLGPHAVERREVHGVDLPFLVEATREGRAHACTVDDVATVLRARPEREREAFAHRYAAEQGEALRRSGAIPFPRR